MLELVGAEARDGDLVARLERVCDDGAVRLDRCGRVFDGEVSLGCNCLDEIGFVIPFPAEILRPERFTR